MVLERFTVDVVAEHVATQLLEGEPSSKLAHRFFRKGRRDGRHSFDHASVSKLLVDAVHLSGSSLAEDLAAARRAAGVRTAECQASIDGCEALVARQPSAEIAPVPEGQGSASVPPNEARDGSSDGLGEAAPDAAPEAAPFTPAQNLPEQDSATMLKEALTTRQRLRVRREAEAARAEARAKERARLAELEAAQSAATQARAEMSKIESDLRELLAETQQRFESIKHTGELLWSRYCNGFIQGEAKRGSRGSDIDPPSGRLTFDTPAALVSHPNAPKLAASTNEGDL